MQIQESSKPVGGYFDISIEKQTLHCVPANISAITLESHLEERFPDEGG